MSDRRVIVEIYAENDPNTLCHTEIVKVNNRNLITQHSAAFGPEFSDKGLKFEEVFRDVVSVTFTDETKESYREPPGTTERPLLQVVRVVRKVLVEIVHPNSIPAVIYRNEDGQLRLRCSVDQPLEKQYWDDEVRDLSANQAVLVRLTVPSNIQGWTEREISEGLISNLTARQPQPGFKYVKNPALSM